MTLVAYSNTSYQIGVQLPNLYTSQSKSEILALNPDHFCEVGDSYIQKNSDGELKSLLNIKTGGKFVPESTPPLIMGSENKRFLRFGHNGKLNGLNNGVLRTSTDEIKSLENVFTKLFIMRLPKNKGIEGSTFISTDTWPAGGNIMGTSAGGLEWCTNFDSLLENNGEVIEITGSLDSVPRDGQFKSTEWISLIISFDSISGEVALYRNGTLLHTSTGKIGNATNMMGAKNVVIGGSGASGSGGFGYVGDYKASILKTGIAAHTIPSVLQTFIKYGEELRSVMNA